MSLRGGYGEPWVRLGVSCAEMHSLCSVLGGPRKPRIRIDQNCDTVCKIEGVPERVWGRKTADRTHSLAFWEVAAQQL